MTPDIWSVVALSLRVGVVAVIGLLPVAFALAYVLARGRTRGLWLLDILIHLPLVLPPVVTGWALLLAFGRDGPLAFLGPLVMFRWTGAVLAAAIMALPLMVRAMRLSIEAIDPRTEAAARSLGASRWRAFRTITVALALPGIVAGTVLAFAKSIGEFGATITFVSSIPGETQTLPLAIYGMLQVPGAERQVASLAAVSVALSVAALAISELVARRARRHGI